MMCMPATVVTDDIVKAVIKKWGTDGQIDVAIEEFAELIVELAKLRGHAVIGLLADNIKRAMKLSRSSTLDSTIPIPLKPDTELKVVDELADAHIMICQVINMFGLSAKVDGRQVEKIERLNERLRNIDKPSS